MSRLSLTAGDWVFIGLIFQGFSYGIYSAIFAIYLRYQASKKCLDNRPSIIFCSLCTLYVLSVAVFAMDIARFVLVEFAAEVRMLYASYVITTVITGCCDFIAQSILIYRCWIVWNRNIRVVIIPLILASSFLVLWMAGVGSSVYYSSPEQIVDPNWGLTVNFTSTVMSLAVNTLTTSLIVFKIFKVYCEVKPMYDKNFAADGGSKLRPLIFMIIESGMALFSIQLALLVLYIVSTQTALQPINDVYEMLIGFTPTIIQVRVSMGLSFHDKDSMLGVTSSLRFGSPNDQANSIPETGDGITESIDDDVGAQQSDDLNIIQAQK